MHKKLPQAKQRISIKIIFPKKTKTLRFESLFLLPACNYHLAETQFNCVSAKERKTYGFGQFIYLQM
jgi:hypothetical protein